MFRNLKQLSGVVVWFSLFVFVCPISFALLLYLLFYTNYYWISLLYFGWMFHDRNTCKKGSRSSNSNRDWRIWHYLQEYFSMSVAKTADLDPSRNYLFCAFPHGVICAGVFGVFGARLPGFEKLFPGITTFPAILNVMFWFPLAREIALLQGGISASEESISYILNCKGGGKAAVVVVGGAAEAALTCPGTYRFILKKRRGFVRLALKNGAPLVPVIHFGENDLYTLKDIKEGTFLHWIQVKVRKMTGINLIVPVGRCLFIPNKKPITTVIGRPIDVEKVQNPTNEQIEAIHQKFVEELVKLFEEQKHKYVENPEKTYVEIL